MIVQAEGSRQVKRLVDHYNLDMIIAIDTLNRITVMFLDQAAPSAGRTSA